MRTIDLLIIGGGSAGMAAAIQAKKEVGNKSPLLQYRFSQSGIIL